VEDILCTALILCGENCQQIVNIKLNTEMLECYFLQYKTRSHPEMVGDMSRVTVNLRPYCLCP